VSLQQQLDSGTGISIDNVVRIGRQISAGLSAAHNEGLVHRDIKPGNILLNSQTGKVLVGDFGLARASDHSRITRTGTLVGTPAYVAPEVLQDPESADHRADLFSLGVVLYAICSGDSPFQTDSLLSTLHRLSAWQPEALAKKVPEVPDWLSQIVMHLLEKNPSDRFQSAAEVRDALKRGPSRPTATARDKSTVTGHDSMDQPSLELVKVDTTPRPRSRTAKQRSRRRPQTVGLATGIAASVALVALGCVVLLTGNEGAGTGSRRSDHETEQRAESTDATSRNSSPSAVINRDSAAINRDAAISWSQKNPFVCTAPNGKASVSFASLDEAAEHLENGGQIEIHASGEIEASPCFFVEEAPITISAGKGYQPVLLFAPDEETELEAMLHVEGNVTLRGLELRLSKGLADEDEDALIGVEQAGYVKLVDCTLVVDQEGFCVFSQGGITMENCQLHAPESVALVVSTQQRAQTVLRNCWVSGDVAFELFTSQPHTITIMDCTFACSQVFSVYSEDEEVLKTLIIDASQSLFVCEEYPVIVEEFDQASGQAIKWIGNNNVHSGRFGADDEGDLPNEESGLSEFERWQQTVLETDSSYVAHPFDIDSDELLHLISNTHFRLSKLPKSKTISAGAKQD
ncbi:MAG: serine/threonine-protein kinase, partial [Planctomycetota bacterium]